MFALTLKAVTIGRLRGFRIRRCTESQLKIGDVNYYFRTGKVTIDGHSPLAKGGFEHLLEVLEARIKRGVLV
jgi:hypothetical protein